MRTLMIIIIGLAVVISGCIDNSIKSGEGQIHKDITVTNFWIGEEGTEDNNNIPNEQSAWDDNWMVHYGGYDNPYDRNGNYPNFTPRENPFYFALPYNDFDKNGNKKLNISTICQPICKNSWIKIIKGNKIAYAQWEDVGPFEENDPEYVFGNNNPKNLINDNAGLDVSPAVRDYLGLDDIDKVDWQFVETKDVPEGPWKKIITSSQLYWIR